MVNVALFSGLTSVSTVPAGNFANASLVGANTVNGPVPDNVVTRSAALTAATSVVKFGAAEALSTIVRFESIAAPPTIGFCIIASDALLEDEFDDSLLSLSFLLAEARAKPPSTRTARRTSGIIQLLEDPPLYIVFVIVMNY